MDRWPNKDPDDLLDYVRDWSGWLGDDVIVSSIWIIKLAGSEDAGSLAQSNVSFTGTSATVWLSSGQAGEKYTVTNRITTAGGRIKDASAWLRIQDA